MADDVTITVHVRDLTGPGFNSVTRHLNHLQRQANQMGGSLRIVGGQLDDIANSASNAGRSLGGSTGLSGQAIAAGAALGSTLLPTIGALAPMLAGAGAMAGVAALAFGGLNKPTKQLSADAKKFKEELKPLKKEFEGLQAAARKAVLPKVTASFKDIKKAANDLEPVIKVAGDSFGSLVQKAAKAVSSDAFQGALFKNVQMGTKFIEDLASSFGTFTQSLLDFGTKSKPALDAWENLVGGILDTGLPGMFREMEQGIQGSSDFLNGIADFVNTALLPSLGKMSSALAEAFGPLFEQLLRTAGGALRGFATVFSGALEAAEPLISVFTDSLRALNDVAKIGMSVFGSLAKSLGEALLGTLQDLSGDNTIGSLSDQFTGFSSWVQNNQTGIRMAFTGIAMGIIDMVQTGVSMMPVLVGVFRMFAEMSIKSLQGVVTALALMFQGVPGMGGKMMKLKTDFDAMAEGWLGNLDDMQTGVNDFAAAAVPRLGRAKLTLNVDQAKANLKAIKEQLQDPSLTKERKAKLTADKEVAERLIASAKRKLAEFDRSKAEASLNANPSDFFGDLNRANRSKLNSKSATIKANPAPFYSTVGGIAGKVLGTSYINVAYRKVESNNSPAFRAHGGPIRLASGGSPDGGRVVGPGSETSDSIPAMLSAGEYVVRASSVRKYGERFMDMVNSGTLKVAGFAKGGKVTKAEAQARKDARGDLTISHFGQMAGYQRSEFRSALAKPDSISALVNALNQWRSIIMKATHGSTESKLLKQLDSTAKKLLSYEKQLNSVTKSLEKAKDKLNTLKDAATQLASSVKSNILSAANITRGAQGDSPVTVASITGGLTASRDKATALAKALKDLQKKGLSSALIQQIAEAGVEGGGLETAGALLGASKSEIKSINDLQGQITKAATAAGKTTADAVYAAQIKAQEKLVAKLAAQQEKLTKAMDKLAAAMEKAIEKAFGKKAAGGIVGAAASGGVRGSWTLVGEHEPELVRLPFGSRVYSGPDTRRMQQQAWTSMLNQPRATGRVRYESTPAPNNGQPIVLNVALGGREFGQIWVDIGRKEVKTRGGLSATFGGLN